jgi:hypothetical protein
VQLHDTLENAKNPEIIKTVIEKYFPSDVILLVEILTHNKRNISYIEYINIVCQNPSALIIKFADMIDNTSDVNKLPIKQLNKYRDAVVYMMFKGVDAPKLLTDRLKI